MVNFSFINAGEEMDAEAMTEMARKVTKEEILDNLYYVPMAKNDNRGNTAVEIGDIRFGYSMIKNLDGNEEEDSEKPYADNGSRLILMINDDVMKKYKITEEELKKNVKDSPDYKIIPLRDMFGIIESQLQGEDESLPYDLSGMKEIFIVFGKDGMSGANVLMNDKVLGEIEDRMGESFYVLPSSIYEVLIVPKSFGMSERELVEMVREVNANAVAEKDQLSDSIFKYEMGEIEMLTERRREKKAPTLD